MACRDTNPIFLANIGSLCDISCHTRIWGVNLYAEEPLETYFSFLFSLKPFWRYRQNIQPDHLILDDM